MRERDREKEREIKKNLFPQFLMLLRFSIFQFLVTTEFYNIHLLQISFIHIVFLD